MLELELKDMTCGHCAGVIRKTIMAVDDGAQIDIDVASQKVRIESEEDAEDFIRALTAAGYPPYP